MAAEPKPKAAARKKKRRHAPREEIVHYVVEIDGWDWSYTLLLNDDIRLLGVSLSSLQGDDGDEPQLGLPI